MLPTSSRNGQERIIVVLGIALLMVVPVSASSGTHHAPPVAVDQMNGTNQLLHLRHTKLLDPTVPSSAFSDGQSFEPLLENTSVGTATYYVAQDAGLIVSYSGSADPSKISANVVLPSDSSMTPDTGIELNAATLPSSSGGYNVWIQILAVYQGDSGRCPTTGWAFAYEEIPGNTVCDTAAAQYVAGNDHVTFTLSISSSSEFEVTASDTSKGYTWQNPVAYPSPASVWYLGPPTSAGFFTGPMTETFSTSSCPTLSGLPRVDYDFVSPSNYVTTYDNIMDHSGTRGCHTNEWDGLTLNPNSPPLTTFEFGIDNSAGQVNGKTSEYWRFSTSVQAPIFGVAPSATDVDISTTVTTSNNNPGYVVSSYEWYLNGVEQSNTGSSWTYVPTVVRTDTITIYAISTWNDYASFSDYMTVNPDPIVSSGPTPTPVAVFIGNGVTFSLTASYGTPPYVYSWNGLPTGCSSANAATLSCFPTVSGTFSISATVNDSALVTGTSGVVSFGVYAAPASGLLALPSSVTVGQTITFVTDEYLSSLHPSYHWSNLPGCPVVGSSAFYCATSMAGTFEVSVTITFVVHGTQYQVTNGPVAITVKSGGSGGGGGGGCLPKYCLCVAIDTPIWTPSGWVPVQNLTPGMAVIGYDPAAGFYATEDVQYNPMSVSTIHVEINGGLLLTAMDQPLWMKNSSFEGWLANPLNLTIGDYIFNVTSGVWVPVTSMALSYSPLQVYDLHVGGLHDFIADGFLLLDKPVKRISGPVYVDMASSWFDTEAGASIVFYSFIHGGTPNYTYSWSFGDGSPILTNVSGSNVTKALHIFASSGNYTVVLNTTDSTGFTVLISLNVSVVPAIEVGNISASPLSVDLGQGSLLSFMVSGGSGVYTINWSGLPPGCISRNQSYLSCNPTSAGTYNISVIVVDSLNYARRGSALSFIVWVDPTITLPSASPSSVDVGQTVTFAAALTGGYGGDSYTWSGLPTGCTSSNAAALSCIPTGSGIFQVSVTATDSNGYSVINGTVTVVVSTDPTLATPAAFPGSVDLGQTIAFSTSANGGSGGNTYVWSGLPGGCTSSSSLAISCTPIATGTFQVSVSVIDSNGYVTSASSLTVAVYTDPAIATPSAYPTSGRIDAGQSTAFTSVVSGGAGGDVYTWSGLPAGCTTASLLNLACTPTSSGTFSITVTVQDANGFQVTSGTLAFVVDTDPVASTPIATPVSILIYHSVNFSTTTSGGSGGYNYSWIGLPPGCAFVNAPSLSCVPAVAGTYSISVTVRDANNFSVTSSPLEFIVYAEEANITLYLAGTPGNAVNLTVLDNGAPMAWEVDVRTPGLPNEITLSYLFFQVNHSYQLVLSYLPGYDGGRGHGANPALIVVTYTGETTGELIGFHLFNVRQHASYAWSLDLSGAFDSPCGVYINLSPGSTTLNVVCQARARGSCGGECMWAVPH
jgi:hypothetical protein